jgi:hypothetical protein
VLRNQKKQKKERRNKMKIKEKPTQISHPSKLELEALNDLSSIANKNNLRVLFTYHINETGYPKSTMSSISLSSQEQYGDYILSGSFYNGNIDKMSIKEMNEKKYTPELINELRNFEAKYKGRKEKH